MLSFLMLEIKDRNIVRVGIIMTMIPCEDCYGDDKRDD